jgi:Putative beta-barrel porin-2, OmpL-like. bbp2
MNKHLMNDQRMNTVLRTRAKQIKNGVAGTLLTTSLLGAGLSARAQDAPKPEKPAETPAQTAPQTPPPTKPAEGQPAQTPAAPAAPAPTPPGTLTYSGLLDVYYGFNARAPRSSTGGPFATLVTPSGEHIGIDNAGRTFDINDREASLSLGEFNISRTEGKGFPLGFTATLTVGDTARIVHGTEPGGTAAWQTIQQLYVTKTPHFLGRDITFDAGIFVTPMGLEVIESTSNDNYSRSFGFQYAVPFYHAGLRVTVPLTPKLQLLAAGVNGWNNIADDNDDKSALFQLTWKPSPMFTGIVGFIGGGEGTGAYGPALAPKNTSSIDTFVYEAQGILQSSPAFKLSGIVDYGTGSGNVPGGEGSTKRVSGTWLGLGGYARYQISPRLALAGRIEQFDDNAGAGGVGLRTGGTGYNRLREGTVTLEYTFLRSHLVTRLEYRHDASNQSFFGAGGGTARDQDTTYASAAYKF